jgi:mannose-6-phosphate isomerase-like protein (cupin superfamily)
MSWDREERINRLATRLAQEPVTGLTGNTNARIVLLAQSSVAPRWDDAYAALVAELHLAIPKGKSAADEIRKYLLLEGTLGARRFWEAYSEILPKQPPLSYRHLANLAANQRIDLVLTTSWDPLLEVAFSEVLRPAHYRALTWGEHFTSEFIRALSLRGLPQILKINGDLYSRLFGARPSRDSSFESKPTVVDAIRKLFVDAVVIAHGPQPGYTDPHYESLLAMAVNSDLVVEFTPSIDGCHYSDWFKRHSRVTVDAVSDFDIFMVELDRQTEVRAWQNLGLHNQVRDQMIQSLELGSASIPFPAVTLYVQEFVQALSQARVDFIAYIDDPIAPGGTEIWRRLTRTPLGALPHLRVTIATENRNRVIQRRAIVPPDATIPPGARVAVVDSVSFSGSTLRMVKEALASRFPGIQLLPAVLVASKSLVETYRRDAESLGNLIYCRMTERHDLAFPWGVTFSTGRIARKLDYAEHERTVEVFRRPWGSGEVFVMSENCSVRLLAIDAEQKLSFQRHICRDELFVALDEGIGIDISTEDFEYGPLSEFDSRIESLSLGEGDYLLVPRGIWHRVRASRTRVRVLEIAFGIYDEEFDIERLLDMYGRAPTVTDIEGGS